jgi:hypothetical protein
VNPLTVLALGLRIEWHETHAFSVKSLSPRAFNYMAVISWARQDSNLRPRDSLGPPFPAEVDYFIALGISVRARDALACHQGRSGLSRPIPQVVSAPSDGVPPAWLKVTDAVSVSGSLNSSRSQPHVSVKRHHFDESPALTAELQALLE